MRLSSARPAGIVFAVLWLAGPLAGQAASSAGHRIQWWQGAIAAGGVTATTTAWSRMYDNKHWLSDVGAGALIGFASAKFVDRRWRFFGLRAPSVNVAPAGTALSYHLTF